MPLPWSIHTVSPCFTCRGLFTVINVVFFAIRILADVNGHLIVYQLVSIKLRAQVIWAVPAKRFAVNCACTGYPSPYSSNKTGYPHDQKNWQQHHYL